MIPHDLFELEQYLAPAAVADRARRGLWTISVDRKIGETVEGYGRYEQRLVSEVLADLTTALVHAPAGAETEFTRLAVHVPDRPWPKGRIMVYAVRGSSEGDYVHVVVSREQGGGAHDLPTHELVLLAKTFEGRDAAWALARYVADLLGV